MKKLKEIYVFFYALTIVSAICCNMRSDTFSMTGETDILIPETSDHAGFLIPAHDRPGNEHDTGNIYADTPQLAIPRNTSVSGQPRQSTTAKRTVTSALADCTVKDGKIISGNTVTHYLNCIDLFPSGIRDDKTRLLSLRKLII